MRGLYDYRRRTVGAEDVTWPRMLAIPRGDSVSKKVKALISH